MTWTNSRRAAADTHALRRTRVAGAARSAASRGAGPRRTGRRLAGADWFPPPPPPAAHMNGTEGGRKGASEGGREGGTRRLACKTSPCPDKPLTVRRPSVLRDRSLARSAWVVLSPSSASSSSSAAAAARAFYVEPTLRAGPGVAGSGRARRGGGPPRSPPSSRRRPPFVNGHV